MIKTVRLHELDLINIKLGSNLKKSDQWTIIKIKHCKGPLFIQTKKCVIPYGRCEYPTLYIRIDEQYKEILLDLELKLRKLLRETGKFKRNNFSSRVCDTYSEFDLYRVDYNPSIIEVYDEYKNNASLEDVITGSFSAFIIELSYIWIKRDRFDNIESYGYKMDIIQMRIFNYIRIKPVFGKCMIENEDQMGDNNLTQGIQGRQGLQTKISQPPMPPPPPPKLLAPKPLVIKKGSLTKAKEKKPHDLLIEELKKRFKEALI